MSARFGEKHRRVAPPVPSRRLVPLVWLIAGFLIGSVPAAEAKVYVAEPLLVAQPSYAGMQFYVYRPYNMPKNWYVTFDGYPVTKNRDGVWVYGTASGPNLNPTNYIVGSVVPSMAGIVPWVRPAQISSLVTTPPPAVSAVRQPNLPASRVAGGEAYSTWVPDWSFNPRFMAIGNWQGSVDRMGVLHNPAVPVAWKGDFPRAIYLWTGRSWYQITSRAYERPVDALKRQLYDLTRMVKRNRFIWYEADMPVLAQQATDWGYYWMGEVVPSR